MQFRWAVQIKEAKIIANDTILKASTSACSQTFQQKIFPLCFNVETTKAKVDSIKFNCSFYILTECYQISKGKFKQDL